MTVSRPEGWAAQLAESHFGDDTHPVISTPTVTTTAAKLVNNNPDRVELVIINLGTDVIAFDLSKTVTMSAGIRIAPGQSAILVAEEDGEMSGYEWWAVANTGTQQLYTLEVLVG